MATPEGGWLGLVVEIGQQAKTEDEYEEKIAKRLEQLQANGDVWDLLLRYDWRSAKRAAFCPPEYRMMVERDLFKEEKKIEFPRATSLQDDAQHLKILLGVMIDRVSPSAPALITDGSEWTLEQAADELQRNIEGFVTKWTKQEDRCLRTNPR